MERNKKYVKNILKKEASFQDAKVVSAIRSEFAIFYQNNKEANEYFDNFLKRLSGSLLVLGCGEVDITKYFLDKINQVIGIDISPKSIEKVNKIIKKKDLDEKVKVFVMDAHNLKFDNESFNAIIGHGILHHLIIEKAIYEIHRVLKKNGKILFQEPLGLNPIINIFRKKTSHARTENEHPLKFKDFKLIKQYFQFKSQGFYLFTILSFGFKTFLRSEILYKISRCLFTKIDSLLLYIFPFLKYLCWIVIIEGIESRNKKFF
ncbi:MAG: class I SAM-dependent methyltransferase [Cellulophaga sp.]